MANNARRFADVLSQIVQTFGLSSRQLERYFRTLGLSPGQRILLLVGLTNTAEGSVQQDVLTQLRGAVKEVAASPDSVDGRVLHHLCYFLRTTARLSTDDKKSLLTSLMPVAKAHGVNLSPLLSSESPPEQQPQAGSAEMPTLGEGLIEGMNASTKPADVFRDLGYSATRDAPSCTAVLEMFPQLTPNHPDCAQAIAGLVNMMASTAATLQGGTMSRSGKTQFPETTLSIKQILLENNANSQEGQTQSKKGDGSWNMDALVEAVKNVAPEFAWGAVWPLMDAADFQIADRNGLLLLAQLQDALPGSDLLNTLLWRTWAHTHGHFSLLREALASENICTASPSQQKPLEGIQADTRTGHMSQADGVWRSIDLINVLLELSKGDLYSRVRAALARPLKECAPLLLTGLFIAKTECHLKEELMELLMPIYLGNHVNSGVVLPRMWQNNPSLFVKWINKIYFKNNHSLPRLLEVAKNCGRECMAIILQGVPPGEKGQNYLPFMLPIDLATLAYRHGVLPDLDGWLRGMMDKHGMHFARACFHFLTQQVQRIHASQQQRKGAEADAAPENLLTSETISLVFKYPFQSLSALDQATRRDLQRLYVACAKANPAVLTNGRNGEVDKMVEAANGQARETLQALYDGKLSGDACTKRIGAWSKSSSEQERNAFHCLLYILFDEYRFFHSYPEKELGLTAELYGYIIREGLLSDGSLQVALQCLLEALRKEPADKLYLFGTQATARIDKKLHEHAHYIQQILQIPHIQKDDELRAFFEQQLKGPTEASFPERALQSARPPAREEAKQQDPPASEPTLKTPLLIGETSPTLTNSVPHSMIPPSGQIPSFGSNSLNIDTLLTAQKQQPASEKAPTPPDEIRDKINQIVNTCESGTVNEKARELAGLLEAKYFVYFAQYLVTKRISVEANFHPLYLKLCEDSKLDGLLKEVLNATYKNISILLKSQKILNSSSERTLLRNLGSWLGKLTVGRNRPLLMKRLDVKKLICESYEADRLIVVIPFVAKILESCDHSRVFRPPNPWLMAVLNLLMEVYNLSQLKLTLQFEIEKIFNRLEVKTTDLVPTKLLASRDKTSELLDKISSQPTPQPSTTSSNMLNFIQVDPQLRLLVEENQLRNIIAVSIDKGVADIINPVVERSVHIACITTRELILKDFAMEPDPDKMLNCAHEMVRTLTGSLALVTCKEPLRFSIASRLKAQLKGIGLDIKIEDQHLEKLCNKVAAANSDLGCMLIDKQAGKQAVKEIDTQLKDAYQIRKQALQRGERYYDTSLYQSNARYPRTLPEALAPTPPKNQGLTDHQVRVYSGFEDVRKAHTQLLSGSRAPQETAQDRFRQALVKSWKDMVKVSTDALEIQGHEVMRLTTLAESSPQHPVTNALRLLPGVLEAQIGKRQPQGEQMALHLSSRLVAEMGKRHGSVLQMDIHVAMLKLIRQLHPKTVVELTKVAYQMLMDTGKPLDKKVIVALAADQLISLREMDTLIAKQLRNQPDYPILEAAVGIVKHMILSESSGATAMQFAGTLQVLDTIAQDALKQHAKLSGPQEAVMKQIREMLDELRAASQKLGPDMVSEIMRDDDKEIYEAALKPARDPEGYKQKIMHLFEDWMQQVYTSSNDQVYDEYLRHLQQYDIFSTTDEMERFFRNAVEIVIGNTTDVLAEHEEPHESCFAGVDALSKLVALLVKYVDMRAPFGNSKFNVLRQFLDVVRDSIIRDINKSESEFNQRPYFRLFCHIIQDLNIQQKQGQQNSSPLSVPNEALDQFSIECLVSFCKCFHELRPQRVPQFVFAWVELISSRHFMPRLLRIDNVEMRVNPHSIMCRQLYHKLLVDLFKFLFPFLQAANLNDSIRLLYKGTLRVLLVLLHDFPEFLCEFHFSFCDAIPTTCIQMRNLISSAFPRLMRLPDPFLPNLKVDLLPEIREDPRILADTDRAMKDYGDGFMEKVLKFVNEEEDKGATQPFYKEVNEALLEKGFAPPDDGSYTCKYNVPLINSLVVYIAKCALESMRGSSEQWTIPDGSIEVFVHLVHQLDSEGRYYVLNAVANQLRYPNNHTHFFSCVLLVLFADAKDEHLKEQITRVLLERLIVHRPHPWGLLITFIELIQNTRYSFWSNDFTRCAPEIEKLFESVARSCASQPQANARLASAKASIEGTTSALSTGPAGAGGQVAAAGNRPSLAPSTPEINPVFGPGR